MSDQEAFATFASSGAFSGDSGLSIPQQVKEISNGLELFVLSTALSGNEYRGEFIGVAAASQSFQNSFCTYQKQDVCYHDGTLLGGVIAYLGHGANAFDKTLMAQIPQFVSPQLLFQSALGCKVSGHSGENLVNLNGDGTISFDCLNILELCWLPDRLTTCSLNGGPCPIETLPIPK